MASTIFYPSAHAFCSSISSKRSTKISMAPQLHSAFYKSELLCIPSLLKLNISSRSRKRTNNNQYVKAMSSDHIFDDSLDFDDDAFSDVTVLEALEVDISDSGFKVRMSNGELIQCKHRDIMGMNIVRYPPQPAMVLKLNGSNIIFPILVTESARSFLLDSMNKEKSARPTIYAVILDIINKMNLQVKLVRITCRVKEIYLARIYMSKVGENNHTVMSLDIRPSDAINIALKSKAPIQISKALAMSDGYIIPGNTHLTPFSLTKSTRIDTNLSKDNDIVEKEFSLVSAMELAISEERYADAAKFRDELHLFRRSIKPQKQV